MCACMQRLQSQHKAQVRNADSPTNEMYGECQELLQMFGLPYIIAPMEAEAQCAWLDEANLVDGVVTDDNDVFLFGGQHVYRWGLLLRPLSLCGKLCCGLMMYGMAVYHHLCCVAHTRYDFVSAESCIYPELLLTNIRI